MTHSETARKPKNWSGSLHRSVGIGLLIGQKRKHERSMHISTENRFVVRQQELCDFLKIVTSLRQEKSLDRICNPTHLEKFRADEKALGN
jgi:hypothetical protein